MTMKNIVDNYAIDYTLNLVSSEQLDKLAEQIKCRFGVMLKEYILTYGYIGFESIEFYGINSRQLEKSDLITQTIYLHRYYPKTNNLIAFENQGEGEYYLVDEFDRMFSYDTETDTLEQTEMNLLEYILQRLNEAF